MKLIIIDIIMDMSDKTIENNEKSYDYDIIVERLQKLTAALYRVTDLFSDKEPLKWSLRDNAIELYSKIMSIRRNQSNFQDVIEYVNKIIKILEIASTGTIVSSMNFDILRKEYINLMGVVEGSKGTMIPEISIGQKTIGQIKTKEIKTPIKLARRTVFKSKGLHSEERKKKIIDFLKQNGERTIKEISVIFTDISEKSVQRDLSDLIKTRQLTSKGEKRWRTYSFPKSL